MLFKMGKCRLGILRGQQFIFSQMGLQRFTPDRFSSLRDEVRGRLYPGTSIRVASVVRAGFLARHDTTRAINGACPGEGRERGRQHRDRLALRRTVGLHPGSIPTTAWPGPGQALQQSQPPEDGLSLGHRARHLYVALFLARLRRDVPRSADRPRHHQLRHRQRHDVFRPRSVGQRDRRADHRWRATLLGPPPAGRANISICPRLKSRRPGRRVRKLTGPLRSSMQ